MAKNVARPKDPGKVKGDGVKEAMSRMGPAKGKPTVGKDPKPRGDGIKAAMADKGSKASKVSPMAAAKKKER